ncbi:MAG: ABC transporter substrate-binding protein [Candidatus Dormiibacterota bacterium]
MRRSRTRPAAALGLALCSLLLLAACGAQSANAATSVSGGGPSSQLRLGYFANLTHATALVGLRQGFFKRALGSTRLTTDQFNAGPAEMEALFAGSLDAGYVGPSPAVNAFVQSHGEALRIVAGATSGGAELVVHPSITSVSQLKGKKLGTPQLGNTQDVALRYYLAEHGLATTQTGGGDVSVEPTDNSTIVTAFKEGQLDGAWVPEPYASELVLQDGGKVLVDERTLWPKGRFATTELVVSETYLKQHPQSVRALIEGQVRTNAWIAGNEAAAKAAVGDQLATLAGKPLPPAVLDRAWSEIQLTNDPLAGSIVVDSQHAIKVGLAKQQNLHGLCDLSLLNQALASEQQPRVGAGTLGI